MRSTILVARYTHVNWMEHRVASCVHFVCVHLSMVRKMNVNQTEDRVASYS
jgi:hypothetical protein